VRPGETFVDKGLYEASFAALSAPRVLRRLRRADVVVCVVPTLLSAAVGVLGARTVRTRLVVWVQDLVLDAARSVEGVGGMQGRVLDAMRRVESLVVRSAQRVVTCSPGFVRYLVERGADPAALETIPNWIDIGRFGVEAEPPPGAVRFLYTGNIGYTQGFETLFTAAEAVGNGVEVEVVGGGNFADRARRQAPSRVRVMPPVERAAYPRLLASAHVLVVLQRAVAANVNLPSKIASYLASARPIVASIGLETPAAVLLAESGAALIVPPEDPHALAVAMRRLRDDAQLRHDLGINGRAFAAKHLSKDRLLAEFERALLGTPQAPRDAARTSRSWEPGACATDGDNAAGPSGTAASWLGE
jgi:glycosyltransferase involved in cell wall biosynthesis